MEVVVKDGSKINVSAGASVLNVAETISSGLARNAIAGKINGHLCQLATPVGDGDLVEIVTLNDPEGMEVFRRKNIICYVLCFAGEKWTDLL